MDRFLRSSKSRSNGTCFVAAMLCAIATACNHDQKPPVAPSPTPIHAPQPQAEAQPPIQQETLIASERIKEKCQLPEAPRQDPQFDFDASTLRSRGENILDGIATCMLTGPMKDDRLVVTGHADPRGTDEYNHGLGLRRASSAQEYLVSRGVPAARIETLSRGESDATGTDESSWQLDRRVDLDEGDSKLGANP